MAANVSVARVQTDDREVNQLQSNLVQAVAALNNQPLMGGNMLSNVNLSASGSNSIAHNLGHAPNFFIITNLNANSTIWQVGMDSTYLTLQCSADCTASIWVL